ncbi:hypothetical protein PT974_00647 [Cladobotryum mycophilum]|uniref:Uncharacterized protein n=1 Tax=Cladobotryum mycophilum TaxID=491253 RepID=A0ABR0T1G7_9HYPO
MKTVMNPSSFAKAAEGAVNFDTLYRAGGFRGAASSWGRKQLLASRVICSTARSRLSLLEDFFPTNSRELNPCIDGLIQGPDSISGLVNQCEPQLVQRYQPDSLGYVWAALTRFVRRPIPSFQIDAPDQAPDSESEEASGGELELPDHLSDQALSDRASSLGRPTQDRRTPDRFADYISSSEMHVGSSSPNRPSSKSESAQSVGFTEKTAGPPVEDATIRLASCFIRCVLSYAQRPSKDRPFVHYRDERVSYKYSTSVRNYVVRAIDDGGIQLYREDSFCQVALLEGKRKFLKIINGQPIVTDELSAQMVGETLASRRDLSHDTLSASDLVVILASTHFIKFFHFETTPEYLEGYEAADVGAVEDSCFLRIGSTKWFDMKMADHRESIVSHILALVNWADQSQGAEEAMELD